MNRCLILLGVSLIAISAVPARADVTVRRDYVGSLNENNVRSFLENMEQIANGERLDMSPTDMTGYLQDHLADGGTYSTSLHYELPGKQAQDTTLSLTKEQYIDGVISGMGSMKDYSSSIDIRSISIPADGKSATLKTVTKEHGKLVTMDAKGQQQPPMPITGQSTCDETLILSAQNSIQIQSAMCQTSMKVDTWNGQPLTAPAAGAQPATPAQ